MKKTFFLTAVIVILTAVMLPVLSACNNGGGNGSFTGGSGEKLYVYNWEDYIDPSVLDDFEIYYREMTGRNIEVVYSTFDTNETMMTQIIRGDATVDLICPSEYAIQKLMTARDAGGNNYLLSLQDMYDELTADADTAQIIASVEETNGTSLDPEGLLSNVEPQVVQKIAELFGSIQSGDRTYDMTEYMVPYMWGTLGILYNTAKVSAEELQEQGWGILWNTGNNPDLQGNILMKDSIRDSYAAAVLYMYEYGLLPEKYKDWDNVGDLINCTEQEMLDAAEKVLTEQRDIISGYEVDFGKDDMINEIVYVDLAWSGDALWAIEEGGYDEETDTYQLGYYVPEIGSNIWYDGWAVTKNCQNKLASLMFIDYMCRPMSGIRNSIYIGYTSAVSMDRLKADEDVLAYIEENEYDIDEYFGDVGRYPILDQQLMENLGVMRDFGSSNDALVQMWERAKAGSGVDMTLVWTLAAVLAIVLAALGGYLIKEALKMRKKISK